ncbi:MAG: hypothetical protein FWB91_13260 [Defluviitaleaceae bacterium]|nr:hypothetical protein [Defluviitaleaceae bacterium]
MTAKYSMLYPPLVERILAEEASAKDPLKAAKTRLHQLYGAYVQGNTHKKAAALLKATNDLSEITEETIKAILRLHDSTKERLADLGDFYEFIAAHVCQKASGRVETIMDLGCGFNPFSVPLMPGPLRKSLQSYHAYDIDMRTKDILNRFFSALGLPPGADCADLALATPPEKADVAFLLKLLPVLEAQSPGRGFQLAREINTCFLVITYPLKSLSGREKGMGRNYSAAFERAAADGTMGQIIAQKRFGNELVYILRKA